MIDLAAGGTDDFMHLARSAAAAVCTAVFASIAAGLAADGLVLEPLLRIEFLLTGSENKFRAAVSAHESLVFVHVWFSFEICYCMAFG